MLILHTSQGVPPVTLAEFTLGINGQPDNYDGQSHVPQLILFSTDPAHIHLFIQSLSSTDTTFPLVFRTTRAAPREAAPPT